jgi:uncharacterized repeat protein (TIGR03843 family)
MPQAQRPRQEVTAAIEVLNCGPVEVLGRMPWASNQTFLAKVAWRDQDVLVVYKPRLGERPLWDFPRGTLCQRELAAYEVSQALGWAIVPPTVLREGPLGEGMIQLFVDHDPEQHYFTLQGAHADRFRQFALFDVVANNADRKAGHCLLATDGHIWGIDHGVTFHPAIKLRTVIWDYQDEPVPGELLGDLARLGDALDGPLGLRLSQLLSRREVDGARARLEWLLTNRRFPEPVTEYPYPWPMV